MAVSDIEFFCFRTCFKIFKDELSYICWLWYEYIWPLNIYLLIFLLTYIIILKYWRDISDWFHYIESDQIKQVSMLYCYIIIRIRHCTRNISMKSSWYSRWLLHILGTFTAHSWNMNARNSQIELYKMINTDKFSSLYSWCQCWCRPAAGNISILNYLMMEVWRPLATERRILTVQTSWPMTSNIRQHQGLCRFYISGNISCDVQEKGR